MKLNTFEETKLHLPSIYNIYLHTLCPVQQLAG